MSRQYFDCVVDKDIRPIYNGTPEETKKWLAQYKNEIPQTHQVVIGESLKTVSINEYLAR